MKKINTSPISGMQELLPSTQAIFNKAKNYLSETFSNHGFQNIETPIIDRTEILFAKAGGDTEKQIYRVIKTNETADDADQALRFDHTVPLARYVVEHESNLTFPFRVSQIGRNFRGERPQKGRFRELYQCDIDVIGRNKLPIAYDAEVIATLYRALTTNPAFVLPEVRMRISNRKILSGFLAEFNLNNLSDQIFNIIDHAEKVSPDATKKALEDLKIGSEYVNKVLDFIAIRDSRTTAIAKLRSLDISNQQFQEGVAELDKILELLEKQGLHKNAIADMLIVRGLDYYTGTVFEFFLPKYPQVGSICGGGRYENLASNFTDQVFPGVGGSIGLSRLFYILNENKFLKEQNKTPIDVAIIPISEDDYEYAFSVAEKMRKNGQNVDIVLTDKKLGDKLTYASKIANSACIIGETERQSGKIQLKDFSTGKTANLTL